MEENQSLYLLSLTRGRLVAVSLVVIGLFALFFFLGLAVGVKNGPSTAVKPTLGGPTEATVDLANPGAETADGAPGIASEKPLPFTRHSNHQPFSGEMRPSPVSSSALLALDRADGPSPAVHPSKKQPITSAKKADSLKGNPGDQYYLQLVSTSEKAKADRLVTTLSKNYKPYVRTKTETSGRTLYMVRVGPYDSRTKATGDLGALREKGYPDSYMVILKPGKTDGPVATR